MKSNRSMNPLAIGAGFLLAAGAVAAPVSVVAADTQARLAQADLSHFPQDTLRGKLLRVRYYLPDSQRGYYRGTRFDWSGMISRVEYRGHTFFCEFRQEHDPLNHDDVCGTAEEFGMTVPPPGFKEAKAGDPFLKIGVGVLERTDDPEYGFWKKYKILVPGEWQVKKTADRVEFTQRMQMPGGWGYSYAKTLRVSRDAPLLTIERRLTNTGSRGLVTDHYGHNFIRIDDALAGPDYRLEFAFTPRFGEGARTADCVAVRGNALEFLKEVPSNGAVWVPIEGSVNPAESRINILNRRLGVAMAIATDQPLSRLVFYSSNGVLCPEPFVQLTLRPGETKTWTTFYSFEQSSLSN
jgi:hypothetical protein